MTEIKQDPELFEDQEEGNGDEGSYDQAAVDYIDYDPSQFELDEEYEDDGDECE